MLVDEAFWVETRNDQKHSLSDDTGKGGETRKRHDLSDSEGTCLQYLGTNTGGEVGMIVEPDFLTHWKTQMLIEELGDKAAPLCVIALWAHCQQRRSSTFHNMAPNALKAICRYEGEASRLRSALERCGFLEVRGEAVIVHEWAETNAKLIANWENGMKGGRPPKTSQQKPNDNPTITQNGFGVTQQEPRREEKRREDSTGAAKPPFVKPSLESVTAYCKERGNAVNAQRFIDHYESNGWKVGKNPMKDWKAAIRTWEQSDFAITQPPKPPEPMKYRN